MQLGIGDEIDPEAPGGAHRDPDADRAQRWATRFAGTWRSCCVMSARGAARRRYQKFRQMGAFVESGEKGAVAAAPSKP